ncbi:MAG: T9SS type A sorting domain-containing protein [Bacteroidetes bacterium]|nr:T9SS type A sorting domain-containing protein [Bacteroidota bacterium]
MKKLLFPIFLFLFSISANAQIPGFEKVFRWGYGPVTTIEGNDEAVFYTSGSLLITGDISNPDTLVEVATLDLGEGIDDAFLSGNRLYLIGKSFFIIDVTNKKDLKIISTLYMGGYSHKLSVYNASVFISLDGYIKVIDISNEKEPALFPLFGRKYFRSMTIAGGKLCLGKRDSIFVADLSNPLSPLISDTLVVQTDSYSISIGGNQKKLFVSNKAGKILYFRQNEFVKFELEDSLSVETREGNYFTIRESQLGYFEQYIVGSSVKVYDITDLKNPISLNDNFVPSNGDYHIGNDVLLSSDNHDGLHLFSKISGNQFNWKLTLYESGYMTNPLLKGNDLFVPESIGFQHFVLDEQNSAKLNTTRYFGETDVFDYSYSVCDLYQNYLYMRIADGVGIYPFSDLNNPANWISARNYSTSFSQLSIQDSFLLTLYGIGDWGYSEHNNFVFQQSLKNPLNPVIQGAIYSNVPFSSFLVDQNRIFLCSPDSGIYIYNYPFEMWTSTPIAHPFAISEKPLKMIRDGNLFAIWSKAKISIYREEPESNFTKLSEISVNQYGCNMVFLDHLLLVQEYNSFVSAYNLENPGEPKLVGSFGNLRESSGITVNGNLLVVTQKDLGFTIYKYKSVPDGVEEPTFSSPQSFSLKPNYPNPFNPETRIPFTLPGKGKVTFKTYSVLGQLVKEETLDANPGLNSWLVNLENQSSGIYLVKGTYQNRTETVKILLVK